MNVFTAVRHSADPSQFYGGLWSSNFYPALRALGHEITESQTDLLPASRFMEVADHFTSEELAVRAAITGRVLDEVRAEHHRRPVHLFLSYFYNSHFDPAGFDELRRLGIPSINFYCNSIYQFATVAAIAAKVDVSWHAERDARASYLAAGANPVWVQMGADPSVYHPVEVVARTSSACFVGQRYADRDEWVAALIEAGVPLRVYGAGWAPGAAGAATPPAADSYLGRTRHVAGSVGGYAKVAREILANDGLAGIGRIARRFSDRRRSRALGDIARPHVSGPLPFAGMLEVFSQNEVCLNFSNVWADGRAGSALIPHVRLRDFEAPMCRTCYLTGHSDEITEFYEVGREIDTYRSREDLIDKVRFYLAHPDAAERLREAGYRRAVTDHTWKRRFQSLFDKAGLPA